MEISQTTKGLLHRPFSRREAIRLGGLGAMGLGLADVLRMEALAKQAKAPEAKAKSVIFLWLQGGVSHHDTFDPKPNAPSDIRGPYDPIRTNTGEYISELLPEIAQIMDKLAVIRSVTHDEGAHERGSMYMVEGRKPTPGAGGSKPSGHPHMGCIISNELGMQGGMPPYVKIPGNDFTSRFTGTGFLPSTSQSFTQQQAATLNSSTIGTNGRFMDRNQLRLALDSGYTLQNPQWDTFSEQALDILTTGKAAAAFDINQEPEKVREAYGANGKNQMGDLCLRARRLVEAGARFVTIGRNSWDHHSKIFERLDERVPRNDKAIAALIKDLDERGMLEDTLVVYSTEFGRTPKINKDAGRDHWAKVFSVAFAGAGIKTGQIIGSSDKQGGYPTSDPVSPEELSATMLHLVGIHPQTRYMLEGVRPISYVDEAKPFEKLLS
jgi:hypothetical protein